MKMKTILELECHTHQITHQHQMSKNFVNNTLNKYKTAIKMNYKTIKKIDI